MKLLLFVAVKRGYDTYHAQPMMMFHCTMFSVICICICIHTNTHPQIHTSFFTSHGRAHAIRTTFSLSKSFKWRRPKAQSLSFARGDARALPWLGAIGEVVLWSPGNPQTPPCGSTEAGNLLSGCDSLWLALRQTVSSLGHGSQYSFGSPTWFNVAS